MTWTEARRFASEAKALIDPESARKPNQNPAKHLWIPAMNYD
jgi:hypothetical protein